mmetsp:Transcript_11368/g.47569  ORF Transcript_11368/g.47569 Transcript_11368/m.47569 type:complete len:211 (-) Transcript_11368:714-1346(-)
MSAAASPSFPFPKDGFFGPHVHARSSSAASTPTHDFPQSESTSPGRCPANKTQGVRVRSIDPSAWSSHVHCGEPVRKSTSVFMDTSAIGPRIATYAPGTELAGVGPGSKRSAGTPHSPPESTPPYGSAYTAVPPPPPPAVPPRPSDPAPPRPPRGPAPPSPPPPPASGPARARPVAAFAPSPRRAGKPLEPSRLLQSAPRAPRRRSRPGP